MVLGLDFIISSLILLTVVLTFAFIFKDQIKNLFYGKSTFDLFISKVKTYLEKTYPEVKFDFDIIEDSKKESNPDTRKYLIADNIISQYNKLQLDNTRFPKPITKDLQWSSYTFNCEPDRDKLPKDWAQRKNALITREKKKCFRCSKAININNMDIHMLRPLEKGGKYFLENLLPVCKDCYKLLNPKAKSSHFDIKDDLYDIVKTS